VGLTEERAGRNEVLFRQVNEHIEEVLTRFASRDAEFVCECDNADCVELINVPLSVYEAARQNPRRFLLVAGHEQPEIETVQVVGDGYFIVEKEGRAAVLAERANPR
jgi:hypothetical protein